MQTSSPSKQQLRTLIDNMSDSHADAVLTFAQMLEMAPVKRAFLFAPYDDEPDDPEEEALVREALADSRPSVPFEDMRKELGL